MLDDIQIQQHNDYVKSLTSLLHKNKWTDLYDAFEGEALQAVIEFTMNHDLMDLFVSKRIDYVETPSIVQFYLDLCGLWNDTGFDEKYANITVSLIGSGLDLTSTQTHDQRYEQYTLTSVDDWQTFIESLAQEPTLIFPGRFKRMHVRGNVPILNTKRENQVTLSAVCVDIDSKVSASSNMRPPVASKDIQILLSRMDPHLMPSYICLTGNGLHFWYIFPQMPTGSMRARSQRQRMSDLYKAVNEYISCLSQDLALTIDPGWINHGYRAPGSITKYGDSCKCFCRVTDAFNSAIKDPVYIYSLCMQSGLLNEENYSEIKVEDTMFRPYEDIAADNSSSFKQTVTPVSERQIAFLEDLFDQGYLSENKLAEAITLNSRQASELITKTLRVKRNKEKKSLDEYIFNPLPSSIDVGGVQRKVKAHHFATGKNGGVYQTVYDSITKVAVGNRERALYMLAAVAYLMEKPIKPLSEVREDFYALLQTPWGKNPTSPLTYQDIENSLKGYSISAASRITKKSIIAILGFNPFSTGNYDDEENPPIKRNGRTRNEHLKMCRQKMADKSREKNLSLIRQCRLENPDITKSAAAILLGLSRPTVHKYWDEACSTSEDL